MALHGKLEYYTDIMRTLFLELMEQYVVAKNPKLMLRRCGGLGRGGRAVPAHGSLAAGFASRPTMQMNGEEGRQGLGSLTAGLCWSAAALCRVG